MLEPTVWKAEYSVGHPLLDDQHRQLLAICNSLYALVGDDSPEGEQRFHLVLHELATYADIHFKSEEALLRKCRYPRLAEQNREHHEYRVRLTEIFVAATHGILEKTKLHDYLVEWWLGHILGTDMAYKAFMEQDHPGP